jgi:anti-sigma factor RsiW
VRFFNTIASQGHMSGESLCAFLDGALRPGERAPVEAHLAACPPCAGEAQSLSETRALLRALPMAPAPRSFALRAPLVPARRLVWGPALALRGTAFAALAVLVLLVAGDAAGLIGAEQPRIPIQAALEDSAAVITSGTAPSPEEAVPLAPAATGPSSPVRGAGQPPNVGQSSGLSPIPSAGSLLPGPSRGGLLSLCLLELGLLTLALMLLFTSFLLPRRGRGR